MPEVFDGDGVREQIPGSGFPHHPVFGTVPGMSGIGLCRGIAELQSHLYAVFALKHTCRTAVAQHQEPTVPVRLVR